MKLLTASILAAAMPIAAQAEITVTDPWARASVLASRPGAAYLTLTSDEADRLLEATSPVAEQAMLHKVEADGAGVSRMRHLDALDVLPGKPVTLAPGHMHLMLMGLSRKLNEGESFPLPLMYLPAGETVTFSPGSMHLMLMNLEEKLEECGTLPLTLAFENSGKITVEAPSLAVAATGPEGAE